jgi:hypothetical protein
MTYLQALKNIETSVKYLRKNDGNIPQWKYDEVTKLLATYLEIVNAQAWYK